MNVSLKNKTQAEQLSEQYFSASQQYNNLKEQVHHHELELDRLKHKKHILKMNMKSSNLKKNDGYQSDKSKETLKENKII